MTAITLHLDPAGCGDDRIILLIAAVARDVTRETDDLVDALGADAASWRETSTAIIMAFDDPAALTPHLAALLLRPDVEIRRSVRGSHAEAVLMLAA